MAGKTQANVFNSLITNFDTAREALEVSANSAGSAMRENEKYLDSIQGRISQFQASWQALSASIVDSSVVKNIVLVGTTIIDILDMISDKFGDAGKVLVAFPIVTFIAKLKPVSEIFKTINVAMKATGGTIKEFSSQTGTYLSTLFSQLKSGASVTEAASAAINALGTSFKSIVPWMLALTAATAVWQGIKYVTETVDRLDEKLGESKSALSETESELSNLKTELDDNVSRLKELYALKSNGGLTFTDSQEIANLEAENRELERNISLLEMKQSIQQQQVQQDFVSRMDADIGDDSTWGGLIESGLNNIKKWQSVYEHNVSSLDKIRTQYASDIEDAINKGDNARAEQLQKELDVRVAEYEETIERAYNKIVAKENELTSAASGIEYNTGDNLTDLQKQVNAYLDIIYDIQDRNAILLGDANAKENAIFRIADTSFDGVTSELKELGKQGVLTAEALEKEEYADFINKLIELGVITDSTGSSLEYVAGVFNTLATSTGSAGNSITNSVISLSEANTQIDAFQSRISSLSDALAKLSDGSITLSEVIDLIQEFPELAEYVDLTADNFGDLGGALKKLIRESPSELINDLQELKEIKDLTDDESRAIDDLCDSLRNMSTDAVDDVSEAFGILADQISASKREKSELDKELAKDDYDANFDDRVEAFEKLQEVLAADEVGSKKYKALTEYFNIGELDTTAVQNWVNQNNKFFQDGKAGAKAFMEEIQRLNNLGILDPEVASYTPGNGFWYDITRMDELSEVTGFSENLLNDMIGNYRMYSADYVDYTTEMVNKELLLKGVIQDLGNVSVASMEDLQVYTGKTKEEVSDLVNQINSMNKYISSDNDELKKLSEGGNVDLTFRPVIDSSELAAAGFKEAAEEAAGTVATVFTSTFTDKTGTIAMNFTPIMVDENGNYAGVMNQEEFDKYCGEVVNGVHDDNLNLKIGATYTGSDALAQAEADAQRIHELHEQIEADGKLKILGVDDINFTQPMIDSMAAACDSVDEFKQKLLELYNTDGVTFDAGITYNGQDIYDIIKEASANAENDVTVDIKMNINDDEIIASVNATAQEIEAILGNDWQIKLNSEDAETKAAAFKTLCEEIPEAITCQVNGKVQNATTGLSSVLSLIDKVNANKNITVTTTYVQQGTAPSAYGVNANHDNSAYWSSHASGIDSANAGVALLGDEYSPDGSPKPELVITDGSAYVAGGTGPEFVRLESGDQVLTADETKRILHGNPNARRKVIPAYATGIKNYGANESHDNSAYWSTTKTSKSIADTLKAAADTAAKALSTASSTYTTGSYGGTANLNGGSGGSSGGSGGGSSSSSYSDSSSSSNEKSQFEKDYEYHNHLVAMERENYEDYINWLQSAYRDAYAQGQIELEDFYRYEEEVFEGRKQIVQDAISDIEHKIKALEREPGNESQIINYYNQIIAKIDKEIASARDRGLSDDDDYIQELIEQKWDYADEISDILDDITENAQDAVNDLVDYRIEMLKKDLNNEKDALNDKLSALKDFYSKQKEMLQDAYDEEKYLEEQSEKRKSVADIQAEIAQLQFDDSAWADKRRKELEEELKDAEKELNDFEKDHALENATDLLDKMYEQQESQIQTEIDLLDEKLNDPNALYNQALRDIQNNTLALYEEMIEYNNRYGTGNPTDIFEMWSKADESLDAYFKLMGQAYKNILLVDAYKPSGYASGTSKASAGLHELFEKGDEYVYTTSDGRKYRMFSGLGDKVLNSTATDFLYKFANNGESFLNNIVKSLASNSSINSVSRPAQAIQLSSGNIVINGNATQETVSEIRRAQRDNLDYVLREFRRLNK